MARFIKEVCCDEYSDSRPDKAIIEIDENLARRILKLNKAVKRLGVYRISEFEYTPKWVEQDNQKPDWRVDCVIMNVTDNDVHWDALIKHTNINIETDGLSIKDILKKFPHLKGE